MPGSVMLLAGRSEVRGTDGAAALAPIRFDPGSTFGKHNNTRTLTTDEILRVIATDYGRDASFVSRRGGETRYPVHDVSGCHRCA
jgi:hypothetical protein